MLTTFEMRTIKNTNIIMSSVGPSFQEVDVVEELLRSQVGVAVVEHDPVQSWLSD